MSEISVIVPVHNTEKYLNKCIESIQNQTIGSIDIILVENASVDGSLDLCRRLAQENENIRYIHIDVGDLATARNEGLKLVRTPYVAFVDSDDEVEHDMYESLLKIIKENDLDLVYSNHCKVYDDGRIDYGCYSNDGKVLITKPKTLLKMSFKNIIPVSACVFVAKIALFDNLRFPPFHFYEDRGFTFNLINASKKVGYVNKAFYRYYQRKGSIVHSMNWKKYYDYVEAERKRLTFIIESPHFNEKEIIECASRPTEAFLRKLLHAYLNISSWNQMKQTNIMARNVCLIPSGVNLSFKARTIKFITEIFNM